MNENTDKPRGTVYARHIEPPEKAFLVMAERAPSYNVIFRPKRWELWRVMAQTIHGAEQIARYHFYCALNFRCYE